MRELLAGAKPEPDEIEVIPDPDELPPDVQAAGIGTSMWRRLNALERYAIASYARRGREERLRAAVEHLTR